METKLIIIIGYLVFINLFGFLAMSVDKSKAKHHKHRIAEKTLFLITIIGGSIGSILGMYTFHHKTKHWYFVVGMPLILVLQIVLAVFIKMKFFI